MIKDFPGFCSITEISKPHFHSTDSTHFIMEEEIQDLNCFMYVFVYLQDNDYNQTYFDNGEGYGMDEDDDLDEGPTY